MDRFSFSVIAAVNDEILLGANLAASPCIADGRVELIVEREHPSASIAYNAGMHKATGSVLVFAHQDVYLPFDWDQRLLSTVKQLDEQGIRWGVLGAFGVAMPLRLVGTSWSSGLAREVGVRVTAPQKVISIDEMVIVVNRAEGLRFDDALPGYHLYGTDIVRTALRRGLGAFVFDGPVVHNSQPVRWLDKHFHKAYRYMKQKWADELPLHTCVVDVTRTGWPLCRHRLRSVKKRVFTQVSWRPRLADPSLIAQSLGYEPRRQLSIAQ